MPCVCHTLPAHFSACFLACLLLLLRVPNYFAPRLRQRHISGANTRETSVGECVLVPGIVVLTALSWTKSGAPDARHLWLKDVQFLPSLMYSGCVGSGAWKEPGCLCNCFSLPAYAHIIATAARCAAVKENV